MHIGYVECSLTKCLEMDMSEGNRICIDDSAVLLFDWTFVRDHAWYSTYIPDMDYITGLCNLAIVLCEYLVVHCYAL